MGFFSDLKEDLSQAVNELIPEEEAKNEEVAVDSESVTTETVEVSLDEMLKNIDAIQVTPESKEESEDLVGEKEESKTLDVFSVKEEKQKGVERRMDSFSGKSAIDETSVITGGMTVMGDITTEGNLDVIGTINGNVDALGKLNITGHITGNSKAAEVYADSAKINGEVISEGSVKVGASSVIIGNISATSAVIAGAVKGDIDVRGPVILDTSAIVMGNIKSKSVQINNGAVIEGMCSQCYAEVSPTSFFDDYRPDSKKAKINK